MVVVLDHPIGAALTPRVDAEWVVAGRLDAGRHPLSIVEGRLDGVGEVTDRQDDAGGDGRSISAQVLGRPVVLASASPRRADLLAQVGIAHEVCVSSVVEQADVPGADPVEVAEAHAREKALDVAAESPGRLVLGADTVVVLDGEVLGKPKDADDARRMLRLLSGRQHEVITAVAVGRGGDDAGESRCCLLALEHVRTRVEFRVLTDDEIECYVGSGEPMDKAGAYGIQGRGALLVREIAGCYFNVVGLPLSRTWEILSALGHDVPGAAESGDRGRRQ